MNRVDWGVLAVVIGCAWALPVQAEDVKPQKITFQDHVQPIFKAKCGTCHGADQAKGGLVIETYSAIMQGGASGEVVVAGDVDGSRLWELVSHQGQPVMPPKEPKLPDDTLAVIRKWIEGGALENMSSQPKIKKKSTSALGAVTISSGRPEGPPPMPENLPTEPMSLSARGNAVTALAASPWAPLAAVSGHKQVFLYHTLENRLIGVLPFPEGTPYVLKFSRNGSLLLAGGGRGGQSGRVVVWDVRTGKRVFEIGAEYDAVLAADISPDHSQIALGGPRKVVRVYSTGDGEVMYEIKKHTDWITAIEFSPDGVLLATGDRSNGLAVWEAFTGREFYILNGHTAAITSVSWRLDANLLASSSEDGNIKLWEMGNGGLVKNWGAHGGGAAAVQFARDGRLVSTGRDRVTKLWDGNGAQQKAFPALNDLGTEVAFASEGDRILAGDWTGTVRVWDVNAAELPALPTNPPALTARIEAATQASTAAQGASAQAAANLAAVQKQMADKVAAAEAAQKQATDGQTAAAAAVNEKAAADKQLADKVAALAAADTALTAAKTAFDQKTAEKAAADKALAEAAEAQKADAQKAVETKASEQKQAETAFATAKAGQEKAAGEKAAAEKAVNDGAAKVKATADQAVALKAAADKAVEVAKPTPETQKALADADAAAKSAAEKAALATKLVETLNAEKARGVPMVPQP